MAVDEQARHRLYIRMVKVLVDEAAVILMAHLPPGGYPNHQLRAHTFRVVLTTNLVSVGVLAGVAFAAAGVT